MVQLCALLIPKLILDIRVDAAGLITKKSDLENKSLQIREESKQRETADVLNKDQLELLRTRERYNHVIGARSTFLNLVYPLWAAK